MRRRNIDNRRTFSNTDDVKLKLHYFNARGRAELIRYILRFCGRDFEDFRIERAEWPSKKTSYPTGQIPILEIEKKDGRKLTLTQSVTIARSLARTHNLIGESEFEAAQCDEVVDCLNELINLAFVAQLEQDSERRERIKTRLRNEEYPRLLGYIELKLKDNGGNHVVGKTWTWADFAIAIFISGMLMKQPVDIEVQTIVDKLPGLIALTKNVEQIPQIADWIKKRPDTSF